MAVITEITVFVNTSIITHGIKIILLATPMFSGVENQIKLCQYWSHKYICMYESLEHSWFDSVFTKVITVTVLYYAKPSSMLVPAVHFSLTTTEYYSREMSFIAATNCCKTGCIRSTTILYHIQHPWLSHNDVWWQCYWEHTSSALAEGLPISKWQSECAPAVRSHWMVLSKVGVT